MSDVELKTRREFLKSTLLGGAMTWTVPSFVNATIQSLFMQQADAAVAPVTGKDAPILVVVQLAGGNDGLNTIVPYQNDHYYSMRPTLGIREKDVLKLNDDLGIPVNMAAMKSLYDEGHLSIVQGVGYPNPNRSHFRSTEIWHTASDADTYLNKGWIGRYFDNQCQGEDASCGIGIGKETPQAFFSDSSKGIVFSEAQNFRFMPGGAGRDEVELFQQLNNMDEQSAGASIESIGGSGKKPRPGESAIDFLERTALDAQVNSSKIRSIISKTQTMGSYPQSRISREFQIISKLIAGGMTTRIYYASQGGYDTHANQMGSHQRLQREYAEALRAFIQDMKEQGNLDRVTVLTFSEFGRRVEQNKSGGTDHGAAAPLFVAGGGMKKGLFGDMPSLHPDDLVKGDLRYTIDFRSVYATLLEQHMHTPSRTILGGRYPLLDMF